MKKSLSLLFSIMVFALCLTSCSSKETLLLLNWGEYINEDLLVKFEEEYHCNVKMSIAESNELFYSKIKSGTTAYDLVVPSDYMIEKMYDNDLLQEIDYSLLPNYDKDNLMPGVKGIMTQMFEGNENYHVPYFWGTFGLMYNKNCKGLEEIITNPTTGGWNAYFNTSVLPKGCRVGMYNVSRYAYAAAMFYNNLNPNLATDETIDLAYKTLTMRKFDEWGTDTLKKGVEAGNLDLAFVYTGDCLDMLYTKLDDGVALEDISFDIYIPDNTIAFCDSLVIPKKARHVELAHKFINFMLETENMYANASVVGYCTPLVSSYDLIVNYEGDDEWLNEWAYATNKYYPKPLATDLVQFKGTPLANLDRKYLTKITNVFNNARTK